MQTISRAQANHLLNCASTYRREFAASQKNLARNGERIYAIKDEKSALNSLILLNVNRLIAGQEVEVYARPYLYKSFGNYRVANHLPDDPVKFEIQREDVSYISLRDKRSGGGEIFGLSTEHSAWWRGWGDYLFSDPITRKVQEIAQSYLSDYAQIRVTGTFRPHVMVKAIAGRASEVNRLTPFSVALATFRQKRDELASREEQLLKVREAIRSRVEVTSALAGLDLAPLLKGNTTTLCVNARIAEAVHARLASDLRQVATVTGSDGLIALTARK